jgi:hypothetical protein
MQQDHSASTSRKQNVLTYFLIAVGLVLFIFGSSKAVSQSDDKKYVEGVQERLRNFRSTRLTTDHAGTDAFAQEQVLSSVQPTEQPPSQDSDKPAERPKPKAENKPQPPTARAAKAAGLAKGKAKL